MKILLAPDKFKGTLSALEAAYAMKEGIEKNMPESETIICPIADGGGGSIEIISKEVGGKIIFKTVRGPYGNPVKAKYLILPQEKDEPKTAFIEMAEASGLDLTKRIKRPLSATTYGTGELIKSALNSNCRKIIITLGGSATSDAGIGALQALGVYFYNRFSRKVTGGGKSLNFIKYFEDKYIHLGVKKTEFLIGVDVNNPFYGPKGAPKIYAKQKGANLAQVQRLERGFKKFAQLIFVKKSIDLQKKPGSGAAGGLAGGLISFLPNANIANAFDLISSMINLENKVKSADVIITGEGRIDEQTIHGKAPFGILKLAKKHNKKIIVIAGQLGTGWEKAFREFPAVYTLSGHKLPINSPKDKAYVKKKSAQLLTHFTPIFLEDFLNR